MYATEATGYKADDEYIRNRVGTLEGDEEAAAALFDSVSSVSFTPGGANPFLSTGGSLVPPPVPTTTPPPMSSQSSLAFPSTVAGSKYGGWRVACRWIGGVLRGLNDGAWCERQSHGPRAHRTVTAHFCLPLSLRVSWNAARSLSLGLTPSSRCPALAATKR